MYPAPDPFEEWLYRTVSIVERLGGYIKAFILTGQLIKSRFFNDIVQTIYCKVNNIAPPSRIKNEFSFRKPAKVESMFNYTPTTAQKLNAYRKVFAQEMKNSFLFRK